MKKPRDSQRSKLYNWERENLKTGWLFGTDLDNTPLGEVGAQRLVNRVWYEQPGLPPTVKVMGNRGRGTADLHTIKLSSSYLPTQTTWYILHEVAHVIVMRATGMFYVEGHGPQFCEQYARLLDRYTTASYKHVIESMLTARLRVS